MPHSVPCSNCKMIWTKYLLLRRLNKKYSWCVAINSLKSKSKLILCPIERRPGLLKHSLFQGTSACAEGSVLTPQTASSFHQDGLQHADSREHCLLPSEYLRIPDSQTEDIQEALAESLAAVYVCAHGVSKEKFKWKGQSYSQYLKPFC